MRTSCPRPPVPALAGLYVHVPFCSQRCVYCDFYFTTTNHETGAFARAAAVEIEAYGREYGEREPLETLYLGGGTPSLLPLGELALVLDAVHEHFDTSELREVTLEANPEDLDAPRDGRHATLPRGAIVLRRGPRVHEPRPR